MKRETHQPNFALPTVLFFAAAIGCTVPQVEFGEGASAAVRDTVIALEEAVNLAVDSLDCHSGLRFIGDLPPLFVSAGNVVRDRATLTQICERMVAPRTGAVFVIDTLTAHALSSDAAYVVREGVYTINFKDSTSTNMYMIMTTVWNRQPDGWKMVHLHESWRPVQ